MRCLTLFSLALLFFCTTARAQERGKPFLKNYAPKEYGGQSQNWYVAQDHRGVMYIGNGDGVLEYDGNAWHTTELPNKVTVRSVAVTDHNVVYVGHTSGFGYLRIDEQGKNVYVSLDEQLPDTVRQNLSDVWELYTIGGAAYFRTRPYIFRHKDGELDYWRVNPGQISFYSSFVHNGKFYASSFGPKGSREVRTDVGDELKLVENNELFFNRVTSIYIPYKKDTIILGNRRGGFYKYPFSPNYREDSLGLLGDLNTKLSAYGGAYIDGVAYDGGYAIGTNSGGLLLLDENYKIVGAVNQPDNGLISNQVYHVAVDRDGAVWAGLSNGIARVDVASDVSYWDEDSGLEGSVYFVKRHKSHLYINTSMSSYILEGNKIRKVSDDIASQCWHLMEFKSPDNPAETALWLSTSNLYSLSPNGAELILQQPFPRAIFKMYQDPKDIRRVWCATGAGLGSILWENGAWKVEPIIPETKEDCRSVLRDKEGNIWVGTYRGGVFKLIPKGGMREFSIQHYTKENGLPSTRNTLFYEIGGEVVLGTGAGLCQYNPSTDKFEPHTKLGEGLADGSRDVYIMDQAPNGDVWLTGEVLAKSPAGVSARTEDGHEPFSSHPFRQVPPMIAEVVMVEDEGVAWLGGSEGLYRYEPSDKEQRGSGSFLALIRSVRIGEDSVLLEGSFPKRLASGNAVAGIEQIQSTYVPASSNKIRFEFSAPFYDNEDQTQYQYYLEGLEPHWSAWERGRLSKEYNNLSGGNYRFHVRAKNLYGEVSQEASYAFSVGYPWYKHPWSLPFYLLVLVGLIYAAVRLNARRLEREKRLLEAQVQRRTMEVRRQSEELKAQKEEIEQTNEELLSTNDRLREAQEKSEELLLNILPVSITEELKVNGSSAPRSYENTSILFTDFQGFTAISERLTPLELVKSLSEFFVAFDQLIEKNGLEKIKTIGDAYMCAGGVPERNPANPIFTVLTGLQLIEVAGRINEQRKAEGKDPWNMRIGVHTGAVVAGVVGEKLFSYDIWGDAVNTASRMESNGEINRLNISQSTFELVKNYFICHHRGKIEVKGKGEMDMYFVEGLREIYRKDPQNPSLENASFQQSLSKVS